MTAALQEMLVGYRDYLALPDDATRLAFLREPSSFKPAPIELFTAGPGDISVFAKILDTVIASLRDQVALQTQLLVAQDAMRVHNPRMSQNEGKMVEMATRLGITGGQGASVSQMAARGPPTAATQPLILGGAQPAGYVFVGTHPEGLVVWGRPDIVQDSITQAGAAK
jgi:hypothetical protein